MKLNRYRKRALAGMLVLFLLITSMPMVEAYQAAEDSSYSNA